MLSSTSHCNSSVTYLLRCLLEIASRRNDLASHAGQRFDKKGRYLWLERAMLGCGWVNSQGTQAGPSLEGAQGAQVCLVPVSVSWQSSHHPLLQSPGSHPQPHILSKHGTKATTFLPFFWALSMTCFTSAAYALAGSGWSSR